MGIQVSASRTHLLLHCPRPFAAATEIEPQEAGEASRYGSGLHETVKSLLESNGAFADVAAIGRKWELPPESDVAMLAHAAEVVMLLRRWMAGENDWGVAFEIVGVERPLATRLLRRAGSIQVKTRECDFEEETHTYDLASFEFGGTYDILVRSPGPNPYWVVIDIKTGTDDWHGGSFAEPKTIDQLRTLAVQTGANIVAVIHAPRGEAPEIYASELFPAEVQTHAKELRKALSLTESGFLRDGPWCRYCPARTGCPAKDAELLKRASALVRSVTSAPLAIPVELGEFHMMYQEMKRVMARAGEEMHARVAEGERHQRPDGGWLNIRTYPKENLSMASIRRALPAAKAERLIRDLRKKKCIETTEVKALVASREGD